MKWGGTAPFTLPARVPAYEAPGFATEDRSHPVREVLDGAGLVLRNERRLVMGWRARRESKKYSN